jgi:hypothetical protein
VKQVPAPPQLSFDFGQPRGTVSRTQDIPPRTDRAAVPNDVFCVLDISAALRDKQEAHAKLLYRQILDSVKHLGP